MRRRWLVNLGLLAVALLLGLGMQRELTGERNRPVLAGIDPADLTVVEVLRDGEPTVRLERDPNGWRMRAPVNADADTRHMEKLLAILAAPVHRTFPAKSADLEQLALAPAKVRLQLDALTLSFGGLDPISQRRYVAAEGLVHLIDDRFQHLLIAPPIDYVSKAPLPRGFTPAFGTIAGVPLAAATLGGLPGLVAERVEPLGSELAGTPLALKSTDGTPLRFLVSDDRRRWARLDRRLLYVLGEAPVLEEDPTAVDTTPPAPEPELELAPTGPAAGEPVVDGSAEPFAPGEPLGPEDPFAPDPFAAAPLPPIGHPQAPVSEDDSLGPPPAVRLSPDEEGGFGDEPYKDPPQGFGVDPFAPDPSLDSDQAPPYGGSPGAR